MNKVTLLLLFLFTKNNSYGQLPIVENLVFEGAGIRGLAYCGAIKVLEQNGSLQNVKRIAGTSAGAITALLLSINYSAAEIETIIGSTNYKKFNDGGFPFLGGANRLRKNFGWYKGNKFEKWLDNLIAAKTGDANITFATLAKNYKQLYITGTSINEQKAILFSAENYPTMPVKNAVRISMSIPLYYQAVFMHTDGSIDKKPKKNKQYHIMVDGGLMNNFPIQLFDSTKYIDAAIKNEYKVNNATIGFRIDKKEQIELDNNPYNTSLAPQKIKNLGSYFTAFFTLAMERISRQKLDPSDWLRTISIDDGGIGPKVRYMRKKEIDTLVTNGNTATMHYFLRVKK
jgi:NTE family protein